MIELRAARRYFGLFAADRPLAGIQFEGSVDRLRDALCAFGHDLSYEPIENGPPAGRHVGVLRTWGSDWTELVEPAGQDLLDDDLARRLSAEASTRALWYAYDFPTGRLRHRLHASGALVSTFDEPAGAESRERLEETYRELRLRNWGIGLAGLVEMDVPFPPPLIVESYFLRLFER